MHTHSHAHTQSSTWAFICVMELGFLWEWSPFSMTGAAPGFAWSLLHKPWCEQPQQQLRGQSPASLQSWACSPAPRSLPQPVWKYVRWTLRESRSSQAFLHLLGLVGEDTIVWTSDTGYIPGHTQSDAEDSYHHNVGVWVLLTSARSLTLSHVPCHTNSHSLWLSTLNFGLQAETPDPQCLALPSPPTIALSLISSSAEPTQSSLGSHPAGNKLRGLGCRKLPV